VTVLGIGGVTVDRVLAVPRMPLWDETIYISGNTTQQGGMVATAMVAVARLGGSSEFIGGLGDDEEGAFVLRSFSREGVVTGRARTFPGEKTGVSTVLVHESTGKRTILHHRGIQGKESLGAEEIDLSGIGAVHVDGLWPLTAQRVIEEARRAGILTVMDPSSSVPGELARKMLPCIDFCIASHHYASSITGEGEAASAASALMRFGCTSAIVTEGERGCHVCNGAEHFHVPSFTIDAVDTTGAGDTFHGAFIVGMMRHYTVIDAVRFASAAAALKCTKLGGQEGIPSLEQTLGFLERRGFPLKS
jgi:sulfofructose kinase